MKGERVLIVDDEPQIRRALRTALTAHGYDVVLAEDGKEAFIRLPTSQPQIVILDIVMPGIDGFGVLRQIRAWSSVPIIVLSARGREADKVAALDQGADDYLTKPFGIDELLARMRALLRRTAMETQEVVSFGDVTVDLVRRIVTQGDREVQLTPTEFNLLAVLAGNADRVLTHQMLLKRVWGPHAAENTQQLRVYINYLRRKLERDPSSPQWIVTDPGVGYRLRTH